ncbi:hypothetical protein CR513_05947, partial [Mucuna pruriens]
MSLSCVDHIWRYRPSNWTIVVALERLEKDLQFLSFESNQIRPSSVSKVYVKLRPLHPLYWDLGWWAFELRIRLTFPLYSLSSLPLLGFLCVLCCVFYDDYNGRLSSFINSRFHDCVSYEILDCVRLGLINLNLIKVSIIKLASLLRTQAVLVTPDVMYQPWCIRYPELEQIKAFPFSLNGATKDWLYLKLALFNT